MKQNYMFHSPVIASTASKKDNEIFEQSIEAFENREYFKSIHLLLDSLNREIRKKYGSQQGNEFHIPHGPVILTVKLAEDLLRITAPFVNLSEKYQVPMMRQIATINFDDLDLSHLVLKDNALYFEFQCPLTTCHPQKIQRVLEEICHTADQYDYKFCHQLEARRILQSEVRFYTPETTDYVYNAIQECCQQGGQALRQAENSRNFQEMWNLIATTLMQIIYVACPQGRLLNLLEKNIDDMERQIPLALIVADGKQALKELQEMSKEEIAGSLYYTDTLIDNKKRSNLQNIREDLEACYKQVAACMEAGDYRKAGLKMMHKFYEIYYYNQMQEDLNTLLVNTFRQTSGLRWGKAAPLLYQTLEILMQGTLKAVKNRKLIAA